MILIEEGRLRLGDSGEEHKPPVAGAWVTSGMFDVEAFCVAEFPFPGVRGAPWPKDGLNYTGARALVARVAPFGRRLCTATELLAATAGPDNVRFFYGPTHRSGVCESDEESPRPLGSWAGCRNALGLKDHLVRSSWVRLDEQMERRLAAERGPVRPPHLGLARPDGIELALLGGTPRQHTFYAPNVFGIHAHAPDSPTRFLDDGVRLCASTHTARGGWSEEIARFLESGSYGDWLELP
jgi:hypothetical protein